MKKVKDVLNAYEEAPSSDVWKRLSSRLEEEMPVQEKVSHLHRVKVWKWVAAAFAVVVLGAAVSLGVFLQHRNNQNVIAENVVENTGKEAVGPSETVMEQDEIVEPEIELPGEKEDERPQPLKMDNKKETNFQSPNEELAPKTNIRQVVLPPNSTLARQLEADPVLKRLSDDSVDWSMPVHLSIPNLFTPNDDGVNDLFVIEGLENYSSPRLVVRDKNNKVVYQNDAYKNTWGGDNCPDGVYNYEFTFVFSGIENQATGRVRIIRS
jgi:gliding motility-associated-like protein